MKDTKEIYYHVVFIIAVSLLILLGWFGGSHWPLFSRVSEVKTQTDTLYLRDTIKVATPVYCARVIRDTIRVAVRDTITVDLPREVVVYSDSLYYAEVSGVQPSLDYLEIYRDNLIITNNITKVEPKIERVTDYVPRKGWSLGTFAGPALTYGYTPKGWQPGAGLALGLGVTYTF